MSDQPDFELPELPPVCLRCGARGHLTPQQVKYTHTSSRGLLTLLALLVGHIVYKETTYTLMLPLCEACVESRRNKRLILLLMWPVVIALFVFAYHMGLDHPWTFALPVVFSVAALGYAKFLEWRSMPKAVRADEDFLIIKVPGYGELTLFEPFPSPHRRTQPQPQRAAAVSPQLNRAVCSQCGFINFASAVECKKCRAPVGVSATV